MSKDYNFSDVDIEILAKVFKVLGEISRLKILRVLKDGEKNVTEIVNATGLMQANVSKQIKLMEKIRILECQPKGLHRYYRIVDPSIFEICDIICRTHSPQNNAL